MKTKLINIKTKEDFITVNKFMKSLGYEKYTSEDVDKEVAKGIIQILNIIEPILNHMSVKLNQSRQYLQDTYG